MKIRNDVHAVSALFLELLAATILHEGGFHQEDLLLT